MSTSKGEQKRTEFEGMNPGDSSAALAECRRQEQTEREGRFAAAVAEIVELEKQQRKLGAEVGELEDAVELAQRQRDEARTQSEELDASLLARDEELEEAKELLTLDRPCQVDAWPECAAAASNDHAQGDYVSAHLRYEAACSHGEAGACANWGLMFEHGLGASRDSKRAEQLYEQACDGGVPEACVSQAASLWGRGRSPQRVQSLLERGCDADVGRGCTLLGRLLEAHDDASSGDRITKLYTKGCAADDADGCLVAGLRALDESTGPRNVEHAREFLARACELGSEDACAAVTRVAAVFGVPSNPELPPSQR